MNIILLPENCEADFTMTDPHVLQHLKQVLRIQVGDTMKVGKKNGLLGMAKIAHIDQNRIQLTDIHCQILPPKKLALTVILALPRPKVLRRLIMDMTSMGVEKLILVNSYRTEKSYWQSPMLTQIDEFIIAGLQQACDTIPMQVDHKTRFKPFVEDELASIIADKQAIVAHPYTNRHIQQIWQSDKQHVFIIGAEGGWLPYEVNLLQQQGCEIAHLGQRILRTESAVHVLCAKKLLT